MSKNQIGPLTLELDGDVRSFRCALCQDDFSRVLGYVYERGIPLALYHADLYSAHTHASAEVVLTISIGEWDDNADPRRRRRARLRARPEGETVAMGFSDFETNEHVEPSLGVLVKADDARRSADRDTYLRVADAIIYGDSRVRDVLGVTDRLH